MIRINLLPVRQAKKREFGRQQLVVFLFLLVAECAVLFLVYNTKSEELSSLEQQVRQAEAAAQSVNTLQLELTQLDQQISQLQSQSSVLENLRLNRIGPGGLLQELQYILSEPTNSRERDMVRARGWDHAAPVSNIWIDSLSINPTRFEIGGVAADESDLAEFGLRLEAGPDGQRMFVADENSTRFTASRDAILGADVLAFSMSGGVRYHPMARGGEE